MNKKQTQTLVLAAVAGVVCIIVYSGLQKAESPPPQTASQPEPSGNRGINSGGFVMDGCQKAASTELGILKNKLEFERTAGPAQIPGNDIKWAYKANVFNKSTGVKLRFMECFWTYPEGTNSKPEVTLYND